MNLLIIAAISGGHIIVLVAVVLLLFGGKKIPELMSGIGKGMKDFKKAMKDDEEVPKEPNKELPKDETKKESA
jgi:sec-independent protein translocase protein TatA